MKPVGSEHVGDLLIPATRFAIDEYIITGVYFLFDGTALQYVGQSVNILARVGSHRSEGKKFDSFTFVRCDASQLDALERACIKMFQPALNGPHIKAPLVADEAKSVLAARQETKAAAALLDINELSRRVGLGTKRVRHLMRAGELNIRSVSLGREEMFAAADVDAAIGALLRKGGGRAGTHRETTVPGFERTI